MEVEDDRIRANKELDGGTGQAVRDSGKYLINSNDLTGRFAAIGVGGYSLKPVRVYSELGCDGHGERGRLTGVRESLRRGLTARKSLRGGLTEMGESFIRLFRSLAPVSSGRPMSLCQTRVCAKRFSNGDVCPEQRPTR